MAEIRKLVSILKHKSYGKLNKFKLNDDLCMYLALRLVPNQDQFERLLQRLAKNEKLKLNIIFYIPIIVYNVIKFKYSTNDIDRWMNVSNKYTTEIKLLYFYAACRFDSANKNLILKLHSHCYNTPQALKIAFRYVNNEIILNKLIASTKFTFSHYFKHPLHTLLKYSTEYLVNTILDTHESKLKDKPLLLNQSILYVLRFSIDTRLKLYKIAAHMSINHDLLKEEIKLAIKSDDRRVLMLFKDAHKKKIATLIVVNNYKCNHLSNIFCEYDNNETTKLSIYYNSQNHINMLEICSKEIEPLTYLSALIEFYSVPEFRFILFSHYIDSKFYNYVSPVNIILYDVDYDLVYDSKLDSQMFMDSFFKNFASKKLFRFYISKTVLLSNITVDEFNVILQKFERATYWMSDKQELIDDLFKRAPFNVTTVNHCMESSIDLFIMDANRDKNPPTWLISLDDELRSNKTTALYNFFFKIIQKFKNVNFDEFITIAITHKLHWLLRFSIKKSLGSNYAYLKNEIYGLYNLYLMSTLMKPIDSNSFHKSYNFKFYDDDECVPDLMLSHICCKYDIFEHFITVFTLQTKYTNINYAYILKYKHHQADNLFLCKVDVEFERRMIKYDRNLVFNRIEYYKDNPIYILPANELFIALYFNYVDVPFANLELYIFFSICAYKTVPIAPVYIGITSVLLTDIMMLLGYDIKAKKDSVTICFLTYMDRIKLLTYDENINSDVAVLCLELITHLRGLVDVYAFDDVTLFDFIFDAHISKCVFLRNKKQLLISIKKQKHKEPIYTLLYGKYLFYEFRYVKERINFDNVNTLESKVFSHTLPTIVIQSIYERLSKLDVVELCEATRIKTILNRFIHIRKLKRKTIADTTANRTFVGKRKRNATATNKK